ncbi:hypothetical protein BBK82_40460 [Lentzea guizhouensis]|uniref:CHAT domain-containing protein n=1 Tax=Lentzea guizhouensis TaxID=1586287 RepID=A0A1B2HU96_9PSEU|nr:CHAT domain-containing protein [Lentzea guizhouensis]ANZ41310.1 hypothetical protein BBK82_40460 [Lentzea guizhouensis]
MRGYRRPGKRHEGGPLNDDELTARLEAALDAAQRRRGVESTEDSRRAVAALREVRAAIAADHPLRVVVAAGLGPQLALDALAESGESEQVLAEAAEELELALHHDSEDVVLRHHRAVVAALRYLMWSGPDEDFETAHAEFTALLELPDYVALAGDLARLMLIQLRTATLRPRDDRRYTGQMTEADALRFMSHARRLPPVVAASAFEDISRHLAQLSDRATADELGVLAALSTTMSPLLRGQRQDRAEALDEAIAQARDGLAGAADGLDRALHAVVLVGLRHEKARNTGDNADRMAAVAAAKDAEGMLRDDLPLAWLLRKMISRTTLEHDRSAVGPGEVAREIAVVREVLRQPDLPDPERARTFVSFVAVMAARVGRSGDRAGMAELREFIEQESSHVPDEGLRHLALGMLDVLDSVLTEDPDATTAGLASLEEAARALPPEHRAYPMIKPFIAMALGLRAVGGRSLADLETAHGLIESAQDGFQEHSGAPVRLGRLGLLLSSLRYGDPSAAKIDEALAQARGLTEEDLHGTDLDMGEVINTLEYAKEMSQSFGKPITPPAQLGPRTGYWDTRHDEVTEASALVHNGFAGKDVDMLDRGIALLRAQATTNPRDHIRQLMLVGIAHMFRYLVTTRLADLDETVGQIEAAVRLVDQTDASDAAGVHYQLGSALHLRGNRRFDRADRARAAEHGVLALKARSSEVLLQSNADHALATAQGATGEAVTVVQWCLTAERNDLAVQALELGRALVLHSVSTESSIPDMLRAAGHPVLAERWAVEAAAEDQRLVPSDLRFQVLAALAGTKVESRLLRPPALEEIRAALARTGSQALIYLLPAVSWQPGFALVVPVDGDVRHLPLPNLRSGAVQAFEEARRTLIDPSAADDERWRDAVSSMCDWSWRAVLGPLLEQLRGLPRIVLVPVGELNAVAWHAARRQVGGENRYACQDAVITYAASARQFVDAARRARRPVEAAVALVRVGDRSLYWAPTETAAVRDHSYPDATCVEDDVRPEEVLGHLPSDLRPGASVLHLTCHACHATPAVDSHLVLDGGEVLPVRDVLRQARNRPVDAEGGLVVLASCASDLTDSTQDEALTLATAFLAAGATGVVGARWPIVDLTTTLFVVMFHHYLTRGYEDPALALRATQLWMLNPKRRVPPGVPRALARRARFSHLDDAGNWAAFTYQGR